MRLFGGGVAAPVDAKAPPVLEPGAGAEIRVPLGETGLAVFPLMLGTGEFGWNVDQDAAGAILDRYVEFGGNAIHTADGFSGGRSEFFVGRWLASRGARDRVVLGARVGAHADNPGLDSTNLVRAVEASLGRLGTDVIDILYLDASYDDSFPLEDTLATAEWLRDTGKIRAVGSYRFTPERLVEARILSSAGYPRIEVLDEPYNLIRREPFEGDLRLVAGAQGLAVTPSHALEHGFLSGRHRSKSDAGHSVRGEQLRENLNRRGIRILRALDSVAEELSVPVAAVALAWLRTRRQVVAPIVNAFALAHVDELVQAAGVSLSRVQVAELLRAG